MCDLIVSLKADCDHISRKAADGLYRIGRNGDGRVWVGLDFHRNVELIDKGEGVEHGEQKSMRRAR
jgi:hypothetical protein